MEIALIYHSMASQKTIGAHNFVVLLLPTCNVIVALHDVIFHILLLMIQSVRH